MKILQDYLPGRDVRSATHNVNLTRVHRIWTATGERALGVTAPPHISNDLSDYNPVWYNPVTYM